MTKSACRLGIAPAIAVALLALGLTPLPARGAESGTWEAWFEVSARVRSALVAADLTAGGRLEMAGDRAPDGSLALGLIRVLEHPWKHYWIDTAGPFGSEAKMASVVTLPRASWEDLAAAEAANASEGARRHEQWLARAERPKKFDGAFAFVVIGSAKGRFRIEVAHDGRVAEARDQMTDRWLSGPFDRFVGAWDDSMPDGGIANGSAPRGYWFWNRGEDRPFEYEPHTYHAFVAALDLLGLPLPDRSEASVAAGGDGTFVEWKDVARRAARVLTVLAPRAALGGSELVGGGRPAALRATRVPLPDGATRLTLANEPGTAGPHVERETVFSSDGRPVGDRMRVVSSTQQSRLEVEVGYRPRQQEEESK